MSYYRGQNGLIRHFLLTLLAGWVLGNVFPLWALLGTAQKSLDSIEKQGQVQTQSKVRR